MYKVYDKITGLYVGTIKINATEIRKVERDFIVKKHKEANENV